MKTQKIVNLLNSFENEYSKSPTKNGTLLTVKQRVTIHIKIHSNFETKGNYSNENAFKFLTSSLESSLCYYSDAYVLVTGNIDVVRANNNTKVKFRNCTTFRKSRTEINETFIDEAAHIN